MSDEKKIGMILDLNQWEYDDFVHFRQAFRSGYFTEALRIGSYCIVQWDYTVPPVSEAVDELRTSQIFETVQTFMEQLNLVIEGINTDDVEIDLDGWTGAQYDEFIKLGGQEELTAKDVGQMQTLLRMVAVFDDGFEREVGLTAVEGWKITQAITPHVERLFRRGSRR